MSKMLKK